MVNPLARIPGVGTVSISGAPQREIQVYCDPNKLEAYNLSIETISSIIGAENKNIPGGNFDIGSETYALRVEGEFDDSRQLADIVVGTHNGANVFLRDVARIVDTVEERAQETYNNGVQGAMIVVQKQSGANSVEISRKVEEALPRLQKNLPSDVKLGVIVDTSDNILNTIDSLAETVTVCLAVRCDRRVPVPGTLACDIDYLYHDSAFVDRLLYLSGDYRKYDQYYLTVVSVYCHRYGGG